jgi:hypothetical protein
VELILGYEVAPFASVGSIQRKDGVFFVLLAHPLIFSLFATARRLNQKTVPATTRRTIASTMPTIDPVGIPCDDDAAPDAAVFVLAPLLLFSKTEGVGAGISVVPYVPGEVLGMGAGTEGLKVGTEDEIELDDEVVPAGGTKTVTVGVITGLEVTGCRTVVTVSVTGLGMLPESSRT